MKFFETFSTLFKNFKECIIFDQQNDICTLDFKHFMKIHDSQYMKFYEAYFSNEVNYDEDDQRA